MTLKQMRDKTRLDADILGDEMYPNARLNEMLNQSQRAIQIKLNGLGLDKWETSKDYTSITSSTLYNYAISSVTLPTDLLEGDHLLHAETISNTIYGVAYEVTFTQFPELFKNSYLRPANEKPKFARVKNYIYIYPRVTTFNLFYRKVVSTLSSDTDISEIPIEYHGLVVDKVVLEIKKIKNNQAYVQEEQKLDKTIEEAYIKSIRNKQEKKDDSIRN